MNDWFKIIFGLIVSCSALSVITLVVALLNNIKLTNYIKKEDRQLWLDDRKKRTVGIPLPFYVFNPFSLPEKYNLITEESFVKLKRNTRKSSIVFLVSFVITAILIVSGTLTLAVITVLNK